MDEIIQETKATMACLVERIISMYMVSCFEIEKIVNLLITEGWSCNVDIRKFVESHGVSEEMMTPQFREELYNRCIAILNDTEREKNE